MKLVQNVLRENVSKEKNLLQVGKNKVNLIFLITINLNLWMPIEFVQVKTTRRSLILFSAHLSYFF